MTTANIPDIYPITVDADELAQMVVALMIAGTAANGLPVERLATCVDGDVLLALSVKFRKITNPEWNEEDDV